MTPAPGLRIAHLSDSHIGYRAYTRRTEAGENARGEDFTAAFHAAVAAIVEWDPPLVIHSGDLADRVGLPVRQMLEVRDGLEQLCGVRGDGTRRQLVAISGNHDQPRDRREPCFLELFDHLDGIHLATGDMKRFHFERSALRCAPELENLDVVAVPHDTLGRLETTPLPTPGRLNVLVAHGVAGGSDLYRRALGREAAIPTALLAAPWDYTALGHWHRQGPVATPGSNGSAYYAGSGERCGTRDLRDELRPPGWLAVTLHGAQRRTVESRAVDVRRFVELDDVDLRNSGPGDIVAKVVAALADGPGDGAIAQLRLVDVDPDAWAVTERSEIDAAASSLFWFDLRVEFARNDRGHSARTPTEPHRSIADTLVETAAAKLPEQRRAPAVSNALLALEGLDDPDVAPR